MHQRPLSRLALDLEALGLCAPGLRSDAALPQLVLLYSSRWRVGEFVHELDVARNEEIGRVGSFEQSGQGRSDLLQRLRRRPPLPPPNVPEHSRNTPDRSASSEIVPC